MKARILSCAAIIALPLLVGGIVSTPAKDALAVNRRYVCAVNVWVRADKAGQPIGILYKGQAFDIYTSDGVWSHGFAYGGENKVGWVLHSALTQADGKCH